MLQPYQCDKYHSVTVTFAGLLRPQQQRHAANMRLPSWLQTRLSVPALLLRLLLRKHKTVSGTRLLPASILTTALTNLV